MARKSRKSSSKKITLHAASRAIRQVMKQLRSAGKGASAGNRKKISAKVKHLNRVHKMLLQSCRGGSSYQVWSKS
jgi:hypothetical protein